MEFKKQQPIYLQIADYICDQILREELKAPDRIPSVRDLAVQVEVNPNTIVRTYEYLEENGIIYKERGLGYFISESGHARALELKKDMFLKDHLPSFFKNLDLLQINWDILENLHREYKSISSETEVD